MLMARSTYSTKISSTHIRTTETSGTARWTANYVYRKSNRKVINSVRSQFKIAK